MLHCISIDVTFVLQSMTLVILWIMLFLSTFDQNSEEIGMEKLKNVCFTLKNVLF